jgi:hypothetical protein
MPDRARGADADAVAFFISGNAISAGAGIRTVLIGVAAYGVGAIIGQVTHLLASAAVAFVIVTLYVIHSSVVAVLKRAALVIQNALVRVRAPFLIIAVRCLGADAGAAAAGASGTVSIATTGGNGNAEMSDWTILEASKATGCLAPRTRPANVIANAVRIRTALLREL